MLDSCNDGAPSHWAHASLLQEFCNGGTLRDAVALGAFTAARLPRRWGPQMAMLAHIAAGMLHMHAKRICHGDLNPSNILLKARLARAPAASGSAPLLGFAAVDVRGTDLYMASTCCRLELLLHVTHGLRWAAILRRCPTSRLAWYSATPTTCIAYACLLKCEALPNSAPPVAPKIRQLQKSDSCCGNADPACAQGPITCTQSADAPQVCAPNGPHFDAGGGAVPPRA